mmetsp:Transcript_49455/g.142243  ORF Transcript_49455/g.142243 Transcript_49455/m.142243 type:complete len:201 (+) Transcript_49455:406-1008(+)
MDSPAPSQESRSCLRSGRRCLMQPLLARARPTRLPSSPVTSWTLRVPSCPSTWPRRSRRWRPFGPSSGSSPRRRLRPASRRSGRRILRWGPALPPPQSAWRWRAPWPSEVLRLLALAAARRPRYDLCRPMTAAYRHFAALARCLRAAWRRRPQAPCRRRRGSRRRSTSSPTRPAWGASRRRRASPGHYTACPPPRPERSL